MFDLLSQTIEFSQLCRKDAFAQGRPRGTALVGQQVAFRMMRPVAVQPDALDPFLFRERFQEIIDLPKAHAQPICNLALRQVGFGLKKIHDVERQAIAPAVTWFMVGRVWQSIGLKLLG